MNVVFFQVTHYRFSIAWTRILPNGTGDINQPGIDYYNAIIDMLIEANITPWSHFTIGTYHRQYKKTTGDGQIKQWLSCLNSMLMCALESLETGYVYIGSLLIKAALEKKKCVSFSESKYRKYATQNGIL